MRGVLLPPHWLGFLSEPGNKADLSKLLSTVLIEQAPSEKSVVTAGGFQEATSVGCNRANQKFICINELLDAWNFSDELVCFCSTL